LPEIPTVAESGIPGYEVTIWYALYVPAATPKPVIARLNDATVKALNSTDLKERRTLQGLEVAASTVEEVAAFTRAETVKWAKVVKDSGAQAE
jgi:tripartite-type tricarboxylate transporter receptor subunit TctC